MNTGEHSESLPNVRRRRIGAPIPEPPVQTYAQDRADDDYNSQVSIDITSGFRSIRDVAAYSFAVKDHYDSGPWIPTSNCGSKVYYDLKWNSNYQGALPPVPEWPKDWLLTFQSATDPEYPMSYYMKNEKGKWEEYDPFGSY